MHNSAAPVLGQPLLAVDEDDPAHEHTGTGGAVERWRQLFAVFTFLVACVLAVSAVGATSLHLRSGIEIIIAWLSIEDGISPASRQLIIHVDGKAQNIVVVALNSTSRHLVEARGEALMISNGASAPADVGTRVWAAKDGSLQPH